MDTQSSQMQGISLETVAHHIFTKYVSVSVKIRTKILGSKMVFWGFL